MGTVGILAKLAETIASWVLDEQGYGEWAAKRELDRLEAEATAKLREWKQVPTRENWNAYVAARQKLDDRANAV